MKGDSSILSVVNHLGFTQELEKGTEVGGAAPAKMVDAPITDVVNYLEIIQESELGTGYGRVDPTKTVDTVVGNLYLTYPIPKHI